MLILRLWRPQYSRLWCVRTNAYHSRLPAFHNRRRRKEAAPDVPPQKLSLLAELFPEELSPDEAGRGGKGQEVPRLPLPEVDEFFEEYQDDLGWGKRPPKKVTNIPAANAFKQQQLAVLVLQIASKSLVESDFRRSAPKGKHIDEWTGPGDILKVIPARDLQTLEHAGYYLILFPNPAYARTYQSHVLRLQRVARTHTPTSIESPLPLQPGVIVDGEDVHALLQDYALCPPSQRMQLKMLSPSYAAATKFILQKRGYRQLVEGEAKAGRSVLFWVDGHQVTTYSIRNTVAADGRDRGLAWNMSVEKVDTSGTASNEGEDPEISDYEGSAELRPYRHPPPRWILTFADEDEARRFIRTWHKKPFTLIRGDAQILVHTEFLW